MHPKGGSMCIHATCRTNEKQFSCHTALGGSREFPYDANPYISDKVLLDHTLELLGLNRDMLIQNLIPSTNPKKRNHDD